MRQSVLVTATLLLGQLPGAFVELGGHLSGLFFRTAYRRQQRGQFIQLHDALSSHSDTKPQNPAEPQSNRAKRVECAELAPAFNDLRLSTAGASSTHSIRFATSHEPGIIADREQFCLLPYTVHTTLNLR